MILKQIFSSLEIPVVNKKKNEKKNLQVRKFKQTKTARNNTDLRFLLNSNILNANSIILYDIVLYSYTFSLYNYKFMIKISKLDSSMYHALHNKSTISMFDVKD